MPWRGPEFPGEFPSLGPLVLEWFAEYLTVPSGPSYGLPLVMTDEQAEWFIRWYAIDPKTLRFPYRRGSIRGPKGKGKSPELGADALAQLAGPVLFDGWDAYGEPVGRPWPTPWVQIAAVSEDQTDNIYAACYSMVSADGGKAADELGLDVGRTRVYQRNGHGRLEPVTASAGSREGQPLTGAYLDETHLWTPRNGGTKLAATLRRNTAKMGGRTVEGTNAYRPGEKSVAEQSHKDANRGQKGLLYSASEGPPVHDLNDKEAALEALAVVYKGAHWVDLDRIYEEMLDQSTTESDARRFYLNEIVESEDDYIPGRLWEDREAGSSKPKPGTQIAAGFDGSRFRDATALRGVVLRSGRLFTIGIWEHPKGPDGRPQEGWEVPRDEVRAKVAELFKVWRCERLYCDPPDWDSEIADWHATHGEAVMAFYTRSNARMSPALKAHLNELRTAEICHDGHEQATDHALNARLTVDIPAGAEDDPDRHIWKIRKPGPGLFIDSAVADVLATQARRDAISGGALKTTDRRLWTFS